VVRVVAGAVGGGGGGATAATTDAADGLQFGDLTKTHLQASASLATAVQHALAAAADAMADALPTWFAGAATRQLTVAREAYARDIAANLAAILSFGAAAAATAATEEGGGDDTAATAAAATRQFIARAQRAVTRATAAHRPLWETAVAADSDLATDTADVVATRLRAVIDAAWGAAGGT